jgi:hypothetical protein
LLALQFKESNSNIPKELLAFCGLCGYLNEDVISIFGSQNVQTMINELENTVAIWTTQFEVILNK